MFRLGLLVLALDPDSVHGQLLATVHLESPVYQVLDLLQSSTTEQVVKFIYKDVQNAVIQVCTILTSLYWIQEL